MTGLGPGTGLAVKLSAGFAEIPTWYRVTVRRANGTTDRVDTADLEVAAMAVRLWKMDSDNLVIEVAQGPEHTAVVYRRGAPVGERQETSNATGRPCPNGWCPFFEVRGCDDICEGCPHPSRVTDDIHTSATPR